VIEDWESFSITGDVFCGHHGQDVIKGLLCDDVAAWGLLQFASQHQPASSPWELEEGFGFFERNPGSWPPPL